MERKEKSKPVSNIFGSGIVYKEDADGERRFPGIVKEDTRQPKKNGGQVQSINFQQKGS